MHHHKVGTCCQDTHAHQAKCCGLSRRFVSQAETRQKLETYKEQLEYELAGVTEHIQALENKSCD